ncbi:BTAD domain-containing putative transcriptional regulator [Streptomyces sp. NPDC056486]|uniref:BTAD domain-containing putative transcriptional regulator n=1 Tax=Streptomyces sp. NPDC056486 TaxID=3345835 RepID=UPI0036B6DBC3
MSGVRLRTLLIRLALEAGRTVSIGSLAAALWPDDLPVNSAHAVQSLVSRLRRALPTGTPLESSTNGYCLDIPQDAVDSLLFEKLAREGSRALQKGEPQDAIRVLDEALGLWRGEPLASMSASAYMTGTVARLEELRLTALEDRATARVQTESELPRLIADLESLAALHPHRERLRTLLVRALHADGRSAEALGAYEQFRTWLANQLGTDPSRDLQETHLEVLRGHQGSVQQLLGSRRDNLRAELTSFVGREPERERLSAQSADSRLITLVGTGGTGKTRLAKAVAGDLVDGTPGGVWLVELAAVTNDEDVSPAVLAALGIRAVGLSEASGSPRAVTDQLVEALSAVPTVLVLDNCEHVVGAVAHLADELLGQCPQLTILATSREPLGILGESLFPVPPLGLPEPGAPTQEVVNRPAVRLFTDRAARVRPDFTVTDENAGTVAEICRRLDGLPLAIELAAARLRTLSVEQLAARLDDRFRVLTGGSRTARPAHRTLRAVVAWGWDLLDDEERHIAESLAVFPDTISLEAAESLGELGDRTLDTLASLVEKSVLQAVDGPEVRFRMLETLRAYGLERLAEAGSVDRTRRAHARYFLRLAESAEPHLRSGSGQVRWARTLATERDNLVAALHFACESQDADTAVRLGAAQWYFWVQRGEHAQAARHLQSALDVPGDVAPEIRAVAATGYLLNSIFSGDSTNARDGLVIQAASDRPPPAERPQSGSYPALPLLTPLLAWISGDSEAGLRAIDALPSAPEPWTRAMLWLTRSMLTLNSGDPQEGCRALRASAREFRLIGERWGLATSLTHLGIVLMSQGEFDESVAALTEAMVPARELGGDDSQRIWLAVSHRQAGHTDIAREVLQSVVAGPSSARHVRLARLNLGDMARLDGELEEAVQQYALARDVAAPDTFDDSAFGVLYWTGNAHITLTQGDLTTARPMLRRALTAAHAAADMLLVAMVGVAVAQLLHHCRDAEAAATVLGAAHVLRGSPDAANTDVSRLTESLTAELGDAAYPAAYDHGRSLGRDDAVALIESQLDRTGLLPLMDASPA